MKALYFFVICFSLFSCKGKKRVSTDTSSVTNYILDTTWNSNSNLNIVSQPTGIGIDTSNHIFVFQRTGRKWTTPFPDTVISQNTIFEFDNETGKVINSWGANYFIMPHGLTVDKDNNVWVTDVGLHQIFKFNHDGKLLMTLGIAKVPGNDSLHFNLPTDIAIASDGSFYVSDGYGNSRVVKFSSTGKFIKTWGAYGKMKGEFIIPHGIAIDKNDIIYVADRQNNRVQLFDTTGKFLKELKNDEQVEQLPSVAIDFNNKLYAIDYDPRKKADSTVNGSTFFEFDSSQKTTAHYGVTATTKRTSCWLHDIAIDNKGNVYVGDIIGLKVLKIKPISKK
ncbi:MAG: 6-bladed beta-propeller [Sediminibacterium sp.]|nr:6-bladed beta-propeller [Sediminibacterium sp.]MBX9779819.1 peptidyl-alpha-hydroxyglycine alpha-amidating lyase family protein [Chitinophagaceae bacterium]